VTDLPTPMSIAARMEKARPGERKAVIRACARDVEALHRLKRLKRLNRRQRNEWASALQLWGERRAGLTWAATAAEIVRGLKEQNP
jgi:hypothetical protein